MASIFQEISGLLLAARESKKIKPEVLMALDKGIRIFSDYEKFWARQKNIPIQTAFLCYLASRNSRMILTRMKDKFEEAQSKKENPRVVWEAESLILTIWELHNKITEVSETVPNISPLKVSKFLELVSSLRRSAGKVGMLPAAKEELVGFNRKMIEKEFDKLDSRIGVMILYED